MKCPYCSYSISARSKLLCIFKRVGTCSNCKNNYLVGFSAKKIVAFSIFSIIFLYAVESFFGEHQKLSLLKYTLISLCFILSISLKKERNENG